ncbi:Flavoprotein [Desulfosporosinus orientis DSM 765]|uniref:Flavoprotein n=1 Tax=Desulfosporosinus orientis (strain ATCC 19365 / DSM 765 / NCIMB 8382 / VKM B-1628 / Singapore I) TaxID=768706 RepID=G7WEV2_DESOD|nr:flavoprotein [Desulfosporosinus orientis]AET67281.1 Flavoprotein [Desulfosporosinus orientis DSM 765]
MNEELINQIVRRILSDASLQGLLQGSGTSEGNNVKSEALVLLNYVPDFQRVLSTVQQRWGESFTLRVLPSDQVYMAKPELPEGMCWITVEEAMAKADWSKIILPSCSANTLAKAALGIRDNPICEMIGRGISRGCSIELVTEYLGLTDQTPPAYRELYEGYIQKLQSYGVTVWGNLAGGQALTGQPVQAQPGLSNQPIQPSQPSQSSPQPSAAGEPRQQIFHSESVSPRDEVRFTKKFLGDKQAYGFPEGATVYVRPETVISPLARDTLRMRRIELCMEKEEGR